jgi:hypothetical protein
VLFSSVAGVWGSGDHGAYAAANAFLDAYAVHKRAEGLPVTSIAWGIWDERVTVERTDADLVVSRGLPFIDPTTALEGLYAALASDDPACVISDVDWERFAPVFSSVRPSRLLDELPDISRGTRSPDADDALSWAQRLNALPEADRDREVLKLVRTHAAAVLALEGPHALDASSAFRAAGFDSLLSVELRNRLVHATGLALPPTVIFDHATPAELARHLTGRLAAKPSGAGAPEDGSVEAVLTRIDRLAADLGSLATGDGERVRARLESMVATLTDTRSDGDEALALGEAGSTEELLDLLDRRFGDG